MVYIILIKTIMSEEFIESVCGKTLLDLVARGSAILAEMQRLSQHTPKVIFGLYRSS